ncbi:helix-turn-helix domain-containing protein [Mycobacteroides abscessus]|uniref:XRE family transcriptional regulator n=1 Tax=Mycobacteroides abscessus TaxID=36809 RepID=A0ABD7HII6_9MYCO|nr:helix-turn-helix transcriptional regulator [Mycobacteroides abscessus]PVA77457.1 XRE family transcriptional regulator [Mycobacteroides abscessus]PVB18924.1 XRE family transcriptional regulator [Mycobacteroides abscessus]PVB23658.1 XRE family transcriptional regulator [Mycobacteroides abscessus]RIR48336.1 XRE family transcriptional regulator [Mycobacteroides abscessus]RIR63387.1 XRE family transcriptional regulator [Mycobacteroides abscessus]
MTTQKRVDFDWNLRKLMASRNLWKSTELVTLLRSRGVSLSQPQAYRLMTGKPERINTRVFAALCDILECSPAELFEPVVVMEARATANAPDLHPGAGKSGPRSPKAPGVRRVRVVQDDEK